jgi:hypothetical protein
VTVLTFSRPENLLDRRATRLEIIRQALGRHDFVCGLTAAWLYGVEARDRRSDLVWIGCPSGRRIRPRAGCFMREIAVEASDLDLVDGVLLTTALRTLYDCSRWLTPAEGLVVADSLAHAGLVTATDVCHYRNAHKGTRGVASVDRVLDLLEPRSSSAMQTRVRHLLISSGLPRPTVQYVVRDAAGGFVARLDLAYVGLKLAIECDIEPPADGEDGGEGRREVLRDLGWTIIVVSAAAFFQTPTLVAEHIRSELGRAA